MNLIENNLHYLNMSILNFNEFKNSIRLLQLQISR
jgi:hypothetical protein